MWYIMREVGECSGIFVPAVVYKAVNFLLLELVMWGCFFC